MTLLASRHATKLTVGTVIAVATPLLLSDEKNLVTKKLYNSTSLWSTAAPGSTTYRAHLDDVTRYSVLAQMMD